MKKLFSTLLVACAVAVMAQAQGGGFVIKGRLPGIKDGVNIAVMSEENRAAGVLAETTAKDGRFELRGSVSHPQLCTLMTNNLELRDTQAEKDSIHWTYTPLFVSNTEMEVSAASYADVPYSEPVSDKFKITGGQPQADFNDYNIALAAAMKANAGRMEREERQVEITDSVQWAFIGSHPTSAVSAMFANTLLQRGYNLTAEQVKFLEDKITAVPADTARYSEFKRRLGYAKNTAIGAPLIDLELKDVEGTTVHLKDLAPQGKFVLIDFWASWCGMCIGAMPEIQEIQKRFSPQLVVIGVSCDKKDDAWRRAMEKHPEPWPQYIMTQQGYQDFFDKYQVGDGVPYYTLIAPDGRVMKAPGHTSEITKTLEFYLK